MKIERVVLIVLSAVVLTGFAYAFSTIVVDSAGGTNASITETGIDRSSAGAETFNIQNSGAGRALEHVAAHVCGTISVAVVTP
jgi:hypothetical protein